MKRRLDLCYSFCFETNDLLIISPTRRDGSDFSNALSFVRVRFFFSMPTVVNLRSFVRIRKEVLLSLVLKAVVAHLLELDLLCSVFLEIYLEESSV